MLRRFEGRPRSAQLAALLLLGALIALGVTQATRADLSGSLTFRAGFLHGLAPWRATGGGPQCANYGTRSVSPRLRGDFHASRTAGVPAGRFDLPASRPGFPLQACELTHPRPLGLGTDDYYGYMFYVPKGWRTGGRAFWGVITAQFHFQNIWGAPISFELHNDHMTLALETGGCLSFLVAKTGCQWKSDAEVRDGGADNRGGGGGNLGPQYVVPRPLRQGVWHEVVMHVHWASDSKGQIQVWHRVEGDPNWRQTVNLRGFPTVQWNIAHGCCEPSAVDKIGAYRGLAHAPVSVWEADFTIGTSFRAVAATMPVSARARKQRSVRSPMVMASPRVRNSVPQRTVRIAIRPPFAHEFQPGPGPADHLFRQTKAPPRRSAHLRGTEMRFQTGVTKRALRSARKPLLAAAVTGATMSSGLLASAPAQASASAAPAPNSSGLTFNGDFGLGVRPWIGAGGGAQCANYGTPSTGGRLRGTFALQSTGIAGQTAGVFTLPSDTSSAFPKEACELLSPRASLGLGTDGYYGYMFDVPSGFTTGTNSFWGVVTAQYHFQNVWAAPIIFELHNDHMTLALQTGACNNFTTAKPGCAFHSNADNPNGKPGNLGAQYVVPPGAMQQGAWHEVIMHVHWAADSTGQIQIWHRVEGTSTWTQTVNLSGYPTVQYDTAKGCCYPTAIDKVGAYRGASATPVSVALAHIITGSAFNTVAANLP